MTTYNLPVEYDNLCSITRKQVREQYIKEQDNICWFCKEDLFSEPPERITEKSINLKLFPIGFLNSPVQQKIRNALKCFSNITQCSELQVMYTS